MISDTMKKAARRNSARHDGRHSATMRFTTIWGWFTAPQFGSAGSGGLEYERITSRNDV